MEGRRGAGSTAANHDRSLDRTPQTGLGPAATGPGASCPGRGRTWHGAGMGGERRRTKRCNLAPRPRIYRRRWPPSRALPPPRSPPRLDRSHKPLMVWRLWRYQLGAWLSPSARRRPPGALARQPLLRVVVVENRGAAVRGGPTQWGSSGQARCPWLRPRFSTTKTRRARRSEVAAEPSVDLVPK